jgi:hypothetical protein
MVVSMTYTFVIVKWRMIYIEVCTYARGRKHFDREIDKDRQDIIY